MMVPKGWQQYKLEDCCEILDNMRVPLNEAQRSKMKGNIPYLGANNIIDYINDFIFDEPLILMAEDGGFFDDYKTKPICQLIEGKTWVNNHAHVLRAKPEVERRWVYYWFVNRNIVPYINGGTRSKLNQYDLRQLPIWCPPINEQKIAANILSVWDQAIVNISNLIDKERKLKQALMQKLLTGNLRFEEFSKKPFHKIELGEFLIPAPRPVPRPNFSYTALGIRSHGKGTFLKTIENPETVMMDTLYEVKENDLIVNITFAWEGAIAVVKKSDEGALVSHRFPTYTFNKEIVIAEYFKHVILTKRFVHELGLVSPGGAGRNRVMSKTDFLNIVVSIPSVDEQKKIAVVLNGVDKEIELLEQKLEYLKTQKKGLMQKLLTGQIRVKV